FSPNCTPLTYKSAPKRIEMSASSWIPLDMPRPTRYGKRMARIATTVTRLRSGWSRMEVRPVREISRNFPMRHLSLVNLIIETVEQVAKLPHQEAMTRDKGLIKGLIIKNRTAMMWVKALPTGNRPILLSAIGFQAGIETERAYRRIQSRTKPQAAD